MVTSVRLPLVLLAASAAGLGTLAAAQPAAVAHPAGAARWRMAAIVTNCRNDTMSSVVATGPRDAWAVGDPDAGSPSCRTDLEHWNGTAWRRIPVPRGVVDGSVGSFSEPIAATSASDAWIFPAVPTHIGLSFFTYNDALRWNGSGWQKSVFPVKLIVSTAVAFSPSNAWAFGGYVRRGNQGRPYAARYDGRSWHRAPMPGAPLDVAAVSSRDMWAVGPTLPTFRSPLSRKVIVAMHWDGRSWRTVRVPFSVPFGKRYELFRSAAAADPGGFWWAYVAGPPAGSGETTGLLHWDGTRWQAITIPLIARDFSQMVPDGHGGVWLTADGGTIRHPAEYAYHYGYGRWTRQVVPTPRGFNETMFGMAWIPHTRSVWAVGEADRDHLKGHENGNVGVIARYGP